MARCIYGVTSSRNSGMLSLEIRIRYVSVILFRTLRVLLIPRDCSTDCSSIHSALVKLSVQSSTVLLEYDYQSIHLP
jgi:hypothetical protein